jgi:hypothetical protein
VTGRSAVLWERLQPRSAEKLDAYWESRLKRVSKNKLTPPAEIRSVARRRAVLWVRLHPPFVEKNEAYFE